MTQVQAVPQVGLKSGVYHVSVDANKDGNPEKVERYSFDEDGSGQKRYYKEGVLTDKDSNGVYELYQDGGSLLLYSDSSHIHHVSVAYDNETGKAVGANEFSYDSYIDDGEQHWSTTSSCFQDNKLVIFEEGFSEVPDAIVNQENGKFVYEFTEDGKMLCNGEEFDENWTGDKNATAERKLKAYTSEKHGDVAYYWKTNSADIEIGQEISQETLEAAINQIENQDNEGLSDATDDIQIEKEKKWYDKIFSFIKNIFN